MGEADGACVNRIRAFLQSKQLLADVDAVVRSAACRLAVVPDPLTSGRRVHTVARTIRRKLRGQTSGVFREFELEAIHDVLAALESASEVIVRKVCHDPLQESLDLVGER